MLSELIFRPEGPIRAFPMGHKAEKFSNYFHLVMFRERIVVIYHPAYFVTTGEILADLIGLMRTEAWADRFVSFEDFVIWSNEKVLAVVHSIEDHEADPVVHQIAKIDEPCKGEPLPGWPTREQWIERGRPPLWFDEHNPENPSA